MLNIHRKVNWKKTGSPIRATSNGAKLNSPKSSRSTCGSRGSHRRSMRPSDLGDGVLAEMKDRAFLWLFHWMKRGKKSIYPLAITCLIRNPGRSKRGCDNTQ
jgi:hypothetical protein